MKEERNEKKKEMKKNSNGVRLEGADLFKLDKNRRRCPDRFLSQKKKKVSEKMRERERERKRERGRNETDRKIDSQTNIQRKREEGDVENTKRKIKKLICIVLEFR